MATVVAENDMFFTQFEPRLKNRFILHMDGLPAYMVKMTRLPTIQQQEKTIDHINLQRYVKGKSIWGPIEMSLYDPVVPSAAQAVMEWVRLHHESLTGRDGYADMYKKDIVIQILGPIGDVVGEWLAKGALITAASFGDLDWANDEIQLVNLTLRADYWVLNY